MNKMILIGNLVRDPELRTTPSGVSVCNFDVAVNERQGGQDTTSYFRVTAWRQLGETCHKYLSKGRKVFVSGPVSARAYEGQDGTARASMEVTANDVEFLSPHSESREQAAPQAPGVPSGYTEVDTTDMPF